MPKSQAQTASLAYQQRLLTAMQKVETALANLRILSQQTLTQQQALQSAWQTPSQSRELHIEGFDPLPEAVDAERTALELERQAASLKGEQALYTVAFIKAIGGNW